MSPRKLEVIDVSENVELPCRWRKQAPSKHQ